MTTAVAAEPEIDLSTLKVVLRGGWDAHGVARERGEIMETTGWRNFQALVNQRYLGDAPYTLVNTMVRCECGRDWVDEGAAGSHACPARAPKE